MFAACHLYMHLCLPQLIVCPKPSRRPVIHSLSKLTEIYFKQKKGHSWVVHISESLTLDDNENTKLDIFFFIMESLTKLTALLF